jgi:hypothetical protein
MSDQGVSGEFAAILLGFAMASIDWSPEMTIKPKDKRDIIFALRETAKGLETRAFTEGVALELMQAIGTELLVLALKHGPLLDKINGPDVPEKDRPAREEGLEMLIRRELAAIADTVAATHERRIREIDVIHERLMRLFDPAPAFNEAVLRAIEDKKAKLEEVSTMTPPQRFMFEKMQIPTMMAALFNAGHEDPRPTKLRISGEDLKALPGAK